MFPLFLSSASLHMDSLLKADIFFFITSIAVIVLALLGTVVLGMVVAVLVEVRKIATRTRREVEGIYNDVHAIRSEVREGAGAVRRGIEEGVETMKSYVHTARDTGGARGALSFLLEMVRELRATGEAMRAPKARAHAHTRPDRTRTKHTRSTSRHSERVKEKEENSEGGSQSDISPETRSEEI